MGLDTSERMLIEQRVTNDAKNIVVAYLLLIFLGVFGAHRFYLGRTGSAVVQLILTLTFVGLIVTAIWVFIDLFLVPGMVNEDKEKLRQRLTMEALSQSDSGQQSTTAAPAPAPAAPASSEEGAESR